LLLYSASNSTSEFVNVAASPEWIARACPYLLDASPSGLFFPTPDEKTSAKPLITRIGANYNRDLKDEEKNKAQKEKAVKQFEEFVAIMGVAIAGSKKLENEVKDAKEAEDPDSLEAKLLNDQRMDVREKRKDLYGQLKNVTESPIPPTSRIPFRGDSHIKELNDRVNEIEAT